MDGGETCDCVVMPVLVFRVAGAWTSPEAALSALDLVHVEGYHPTRAQAYRLTDAEAWAIVCPWCRAVFLADIDAPDDLDVVELVNLVEDQPWPDDTAGDRDRLW